MPVSRREIPYDPIKAPQKTVTWTEMQAILAKHKPPEVTVEVQKPVAPEPPSGAIQAPPLKWAKPVERPDGTGYCLSACGRFSIDKSLSAGRFRYTAWKISSPIGEWRVLLGACDSASEAVALCRSAK